MGWVADALNALEAGRNAEVRPIGGSMKGRIESGDLVTIAPVGDREVQPGDVVFVRWKASYLLHFAKEISRPASGVALVLIANNLGRENGWTELRDVVGIVVSVKSGRAPIAFR